jgi:hypothetical protein
MPRRRGDAPGPASGQVPLARTQAEGYPAGLTQEVHESYAA